MFRGAITTRSWASLRYRRQPHARRDGVAGRGRESEARPQTRLGASWSSPRSIGKREGEDFHFQGLVAGQHTLLLDGPGDMARKLEIDVPDADFTFEVPAP